MNKVYVRSVNGPVPTRQRIVANIQDDKHDKVSQSRARKKINFHDFHGEIVTQMPLTLRRFIQHRHPEGGEDVSMVDPQLLFLSIAHLMHSLKSGDNPRFYIVLCTLSHKGFGLVYPRIHRGTLHVT